jgi:cobalt-precorrin-5B (C1)-methyltransferase
MTESRPRSGFTLPVFACAAAIAALRWLRQPQPLTTVAVNLLDPAITVDIPIAQVAGLTPQTALAITHSDPGDNLDLTRNTPIWAMVAAQKAAARGAEGELAEARERPAITLIAGEGIGKLADGQGAIYGYAQRLIRENLAQWLEPGMTITVTLILPEGRSLAQRTANEAFGVVEGLSLLGTSGIAQPLSAPGQLELFRQELQQKARQFDCLVFCVGENGLALAAQLGIDPACTVKTANWLGSLLVEAGLQQVKSVLLFGYHGKLIKLAGGIFHTHHHVADGRLEILTAHCAQAGLPTADLQKIFNFATAEAGLTYLRALDAAGSDWVQLVYGTVAATIDQRCQHYIFTHSAQTVQVGSLLFDRQRQILVTSKIAPKLLELVKRSH